MRASDVRRIRLGAFVRPAAETGTGQPRVEAVYGYLVAHERATLLLDTGIGRADDETEAWYRPRRIDLEQALHEDAGTDIAQIDLVVNCHLHFDHCGGNRDFGATPILCQRTELDTAARPDYTVPDLVDFPGANYDVLDGESEVLPGVHIIPTPGHVAGHQSVVVECDDGSVVLAGQSHDSASLWSADALATSARAAGLTEPLPTFAQWMTRLLEFDPRRVYFAHDAAVWIP